MKLFGHPVHILLIHFPVALFPMDWICGILFIYSGKLSFADAAFYALTGAVIMGWIAVFFGGLDLIKFLGKTDIIKKILIHGAVTISVLIVYSLIFLFSLNNYPHYYVINTQVLIVKGLLIFVLSLGNYLGGNLILKHKVGVEK